MVAVGIGEAGLAVGEIRAPDIVRAKPAAWTL
jgi:hypothetical protein